MESMSEVVEDLGGAGGGGTPLGGVIMRISNSNDITEDGQRFLRCGFVETDLTDLDPSVINNGIHFETFGEPITIGDRMTEYAISDDGQHIGYIHGDGGQYAIFSHDGGLTFATVAVLSAGYSLQGLCTDGQGNWLMTGYDSNLASETKSSIDNGVTFQTVIMPSVPTQARSQACWHSRETGGWLVSYQSNSATGTDGCVYYSPTNVTGAWLKGDNSSNGIQTNSQNIKVLPPRDGNGTWFCAFRRATNTYHLAMSKDDCASWTKIGIDAITWTHEEPISGMYTVAAKPKSVFVISDAAGPGATGDTMVTEVDTNIAGTVNSRVLARRHYDPNQKDNYEFLLNGFYAPENSNYQGTAYSSNGWATTDGISFKKHYQWSTDSASLPLLHYIPDDTHWVMYNAQNDNYAREPFRIMVPAAGVAIGYNEGAAAQFVKISEE